MPGKADCFPRKWKAISRWDFGGIQTSAGGYVSSSCASAQSDWRSSKCSTRVSRLHKMIPSWLSQKASARARQSGGSWLSTAISPLHRREPMLSASKRALRITDSTSPLRLGRRITRAGLRPPRLRDNQSKMLQIKFARPIRHSSSTARTSSPLIIDSSLPFRICPALTRPNIMAASDPNRNGLTAYRPNLIRRVSAIRRRTVPGQIQPMRAFGRGCLLPLYAKRGKRLKFHVKQREFWLEFPTGYAIIP